MILINSNSTKSLSILCFPLFLSTIREMDSQFQQQQFHHHFQNPQRQYPHHNQQKNNLTRFNSAPSSCFSSFLDDKSGENRDDFSNARPLSPETERIFANFMASMSGDQNNESLSSQKIVYHSQSKPPLAKQSNSVSRSTSSIPTKMIKIEGGINENNNSNTNLSGLTRYGSSPAGFFSNMFNIDQGLMNQNSNNIEAELNASEDKSGIGMNYHPQPLSHHLSLPKPSVELSAMEKLLDLQDIVPCRVRAKRGFATHPRSIAERVRRTKISERMRKLQALVPNMSEQTNTADMLDLAVDYIKDLQNQVKALNDSRDKCTCC